jgi:hypothetical protein
MNSVVVFRTVSFSTQIPSDVEPWWTGYWRIFFPVKATRHSDRWLKYPSSIHTRHDGERYYAGYWEADRGRVGHDHHWDRDRDRDFRDRDRHDERRGDHDHHQNDR